jgi:hypothetical protein
MDEIRKTLQAAGAQIIASSKPGTQPHHNSSEIYFTANFEHKAKQWGLSEADALDVYFHGEDGQKSGQRCRTYNGYILCIYYGQSSKTGKPYISTIWKRDRR